MLQKTVFNCFSPDFIFLYIYAYLEKLSKTGGDFLPEKKKKRIWNSTFPTVYKCIFFIILKTNKYGVIFNLS